MFDGLRNWRSSHFSLLTRCPECGKILDFKIGRHRCKRQRGFEVLQKKK